MDLPENSSSEVAIFVHNKDQMYFPKTDEIYGSTYQSIKINEKLLKNNDSRFQLDYSVKRTRWKALDTQNKRCGTSNSAGHVTPCITNYLENTMSDPKVKR